MEFSKLSWIHRGGVITNYYLPQSTNELEEVITNLNKSGAQYLVVGHTSNIYFKNSYNIQNLVQTSKLTNYTILEDYVECECGVHVRLLARDMVKRGYKGFEGLVDLPGTIGGAVVNNSGCYGCQISDLLLGAKLLQPNGVVSYLSPQELAFTFRSSSLKRGEVKGIILTVTLRLVHGDPDELMKLAEIAHQDRLRTQPGPQNNLGSTYYSFGGRTLYGESLRIVSGIYSKCLSLLGKDAKYRGKKRYELEFILAGGRKVIPYLWSSNRFIWKDNRADQVFQQYQKVLKRIYVDPKLEIEIFE